MPHTQPLPDAKEIRPVLLPDVATQPHPTGETEPQFLDIAPEVEPEPIVLPPKKDSSEPRTGQKGR